MAATRPLAQAAHEHRWHREPDGRHDGAFVLSSSDAVLYHRGVGRAVVLIAGLGFVACACGTTVITAQPGYEWCVEVQTPKGSVSDPAVFNVFIAEPETNLDPEGCLCFSAAEDALLETGSDAELLGQPLPAGYEALRDELVEAARLRCTQLALGHEPPLMYTSCLSVETSLPHRGDGAGCTICIETGVWSGSEQEVECPPGLGDATAGASGTSTGETTTTAEATTTGHASVDETGMIDGSGEGLL